MLEFGSRQNMTDIDTKRAITRWFVSLAEFSCFDIIPNGIPGLEIPQSRIPGLRKRVRDWNL